MDRNWKMDVHLIFFLLFKINHMGFRAHLFVWDWQKRCEILRHELHKVRVQDLCFSADEEHIISLGGKDCGMIIVWNINKK